MSADELVDLVRVWAEKENVRAVTVFDGHEPGEEERDGVVVVWTGSETADDWIVRESARFKPYWLVNLRSRVARASARSRADDRRRDVPPRDQGTVTGTRCTALFA